MYSFDSKIASRGYHMHRKSTWENAKSGDEVKMEIETNKSSKSIDAYACTIKIKHKFFDTWLTVGHIILESRQKTTKKRAVMMKKLISK